MSTHTYTRTFVDGDWDLNGNLSKAIELAFPGKTFVTRAAFTEVAVVFDEELTAGEITVLDTVVETQRSEFDPLPALKVRRIEEIDFRTEELIVAGFQHAGKNFSLSTNAQIKWMGAYTLRAFFTAASAYPLTVNTKDDMDTYDVTDEDDLAAIWQTVGGSVLTILGGDTALKNAIRAATTVAEVNAIVDTR